MSHLNEREDRLRGCGKRRENKIKRQGRERTSRRGGVSAMKGKQEHYVTQTFFLPYPETCRISTTRNHTWAPIGSPVLTTGPLKKSQRHIDFCVHTYTPVHIHILISERKGDSQRKMDLGLLFPPTIDINGSNNI